MTTTKKVFGLACTTCFLGNRNNPEVVWGCSECERTGSRGCERCADGAGAERTVMDFCDYCHREQWGYWVGFEFVRQ